MVPSRQEQHFIDHPRLPFLTLRSTFNSGLAYKTHQHETVSLGVVLEGTTRSTINGSEYHLQAGDMVLIPPHCAHACNPKTGHRSYHMLYIDQQWCVEVLNANPDQMVFTTKQHVLRDATLFASLKAWLDDFSNPQYDDLTPLTAIIQHAGDLTPASPRHLDRITQSEQSIQALAAEQGMSQEGFIRAIKRQTGLSPLALRHNQRIELAKQFIAQGMPLIEVALLVGYQDQSQFHKHFVHFTAATPKQYQGRLTSPPTTTRKS
ncbi:AraC family transcriptional regulator [Marinomonas piezotolerans]|uniref:AraC family transcriptional regulator n=1 Tax=Marinomonas piezotolerans TaxID=2213058 RepID=A0A370UBX4_9GAMM|nr:AraC family transcriptional regulator [Marinomonas piezotolerans]RDL45300.1 AraC family transcriptional regulator [Marinomonas piezotolerans]